MNPAVLIRHLDAAGNRPRRLGDMTAAVCPACWTTTPPDARDLIIWPTHDDTDCDVFCLNPACRTNNPDTRRLHADLTTYLHGGQVEPSLDDINVWITKTIGVDAMRQAITTQSPAPTATARQADTRRPRARTPRAWRPAA